MGRIGRNGQIWKTTNPPGRFTPPRYALRPPALCPAPCKGNSTLQGRRATIGYYPK